MINVFDFGMVFQRKATQAVYDYVEGGAWDEWTIKRNREAFGRVTFRPRVLAGVDQIDTSTELFGVTLASPIMIAPTGAHRRLHDEAEAATRRGAAAAGTLMAVSTGSSLPVNQIAAASPAPWIFQLYPLPDRPGALRRAEMAAGLGAKALLFTVDTPYLGSMERMQRANLATVPPGSTGLNKQFLAKLDWSFLPELIKTAKVPVYVKGILTSADALRAVEQGASGIVVSNHGGRVLDGTPSTIEMLPEIVDSAGKRTVVLIDGGFRRGSDVLKALALGAKGVFVGRPPLYGLGTFGEDGVRRVMELLNRELTLAMGLAGCPSLGSIKRELVHVDRA
ncbi:MAG: alpha-hydroxy-acid oxidizing protein [Acidobacteria bacterium]|nr:alpha-hydroxy-acid oxidizing protein [Acidobacteriota bacterium]